MITESQKTAKKKIQVASFISTPRAVGNNKGKFKKKLCLLL